MKELNRGTVIKKIGFHFVFEQKNERRHRSARPCRVSYLRLIRLDILRIIFVTLKKRVSRTCTKLEEIFPAELEPWIRPFELHQDVARNLLACKLKSRLTFDSCQPQHPGNFSLGKLMKMDKLQHQNRFGISFGESVSNRGSEQFQNRLFVRDQFRLWPAIKKIA